VTSPYRDAIVDTATITRVEDGRDGPQYEVSVDGVVLGRVRRSRRTWERRTPGRRYVNHRGETPCWRIEGSDGWRTFDTRHEAVASLIRHGGR
jgi:hypothetical protein